MNKPSLFRCAAMASVPALLIMTTMTAATQTLVSGAPAGREGLRVVPPLRALGGDRFQSTEHSVTVAFEAAKPGGPMKLEETIDGGPAVTYEPMPPAKVDARILAAYAGTYDSKELGTAWTLAIRDSVLMLQHRSLGDTRLEPAFADAFTAGPTLIRFARVKGGRVTGFSVSMGRARNILFVRRA